MEKKTTNITRSWGATIGFLIGAIVAFGISGLLFMTIVEGPITVGITAGASCPNNLIEDTIRRLFELRGISVKELLESQ